MSITNPSSLSIRVHEFFWLKLMKGYYQKLVKSLDLKGNEKVMDFGCGPGAASKFIASALAKHGGELTCFDISDTWIERAKVHLSHFSNVKYYAADIRDWQENDDYFDTVIIHFMLHDIEESMRLSVVKALAKKMKTGAKLFIREPIKENHGISIQEIQELMGSCGMNETESYRGKSFMKGPVYTGIYIGSNLIF